MHMHTSLCVAGLLLLGVVVSAQDPGRQQLLPTGKLRAGINAGNALTRAVGAQLARELARRLGAEAVLIEYPTPGAVTDAVGKEWDVAFIAADPERAGAIALRRHTSSSTRPIWSATHRPFGRWPTSTARARRSPPAGPAPTRSCSDASWRE